MNQSNLLHAFLVQLRCIGIKWALPFCWFLGLLLGTTYGYRADHSYILLLRYAALNRVSFVGLIAALYVPLLLSTLAVYLNHPQWLLPICFIKAFLFTSCGSALLIAYHSAGWLVRLLLQFSDFCTMPFLYWFCMRNIVERKSNLASDFLVCCTGGSIIGIFDFFVISPYLVKLIHI